MHVLVYYILICAMDGIVAIKLARPTVYHQRHVQSWVIVTLMSYEDT